MSSFTTITLSYQTFTSLVITGTKNLKIEQIKIIEEVDN